MAITAKPSKGSAKRTNTTATKEKHFYQCQSCGETKSESHFHYSFSSEIWIVSDKRPLFCRECVNQKFKLVTERHGERNALIVICAMLDLPFIDSMYVSIMQKNGVFSLSEYISRLNGPQYRKMTFVNTLLDNSSIQSSDDEETDGVRWSKSDKQNKQFVISIVGYDPFEELPAKDRKRCFNIMAGYCDTDGIQEDGHKIESIVQITQSLLQCEKLNELINAELLKKSPNEDKVKQLTATKKQLSDSISKIAQDNNISSAYSKTAKQGTNTLTYKEREMMQRGFEDAAVNLFDIKTCDAMKQFLDLSNQSIMEQLTFDANDYTAMIKEQRELVNKLQDENDQLKENNRLLKNQIIDLETRGKKK